jgi:hypothetical protein
VSRDPILITAVSKRIGLHSAHIRCEKDRDHASMRVLAEILRYRYESQGPTTALPGPRGSAS